MMHASASATRSRAARPSPGPALALLLLCGLFELPACLLPEPFRPTGELMLLLAGWLLGLRLQPRRRRLLFWLLGLAAAALALVRADRVAFLRFMGEEPLLYDQLFMLRHLLVLFSDLWSWRVGAMLSGIVVAVALCVFALRRACSALGRVLLAGDSRVSARAGAALLVLALAGSVLPAGASPCVRFMTPRLLADLARSRRIYAGVQRGIGRSPYRPLAALELRRRPDVYLIFVESYGRVLLEDARLRPGYEAQIRAMQRALEDAGWHAVSDFSSAPIMGGRSWLAEGSVLMGIHVAYEAVFRHLIEQIARVPNLVSFLSGHGYNTVLLAPSDRKRPGVEEVNYYHHQRCVRFDDLGYRGPRVGWGIVPDQYSLFYTDEHVLRGTPRPLFLEYHMVTSHAPWEDVPRLVPDYRALNERPGEPLDDEDTGEGLRRLRRYVHWKRRFAYLGPLGARMADGYGATVRYDLQVLQRFLLGLQDDALVIVIGDHQPPFLAAGTRSFDTPVHVLARDPALLQELREHGFAGGLWLGSTAHVPVRHEGLFSLLARDLARCCGNSPRLPAYLPHGADLEGLQARSPGRK